MEIRFIGAAKTVTGSLHLIKANGKIYSTFATKDLSEIMLRDSGHIQVKDTEFVNKRRKKQGKNPFEPLYTEEDAIKTLEYFVGLNYHHETEIAENIRLTFF